MASWARLILGDWDPRSPRQVDDDIREELSLHVDLLEEELCREGLSVVEAKAEAGRRFGDVEKYSRACREVALKERIMLQRINLVLLVLVTVGLGVTAWQSWASQSRTADAVEGLSKQVAALNTSKRGEAGNTQSVTITGDIRRGGVYAIPTEGLTLRRLLAAAGWDGKMNVDVSLQRLDPSGKNTTTRIEWAKISDEKGQDEQLKPGDLLFVTQRGGVIVVPDVNGAPAKEANPDEFGRLAELRFNERVLAGFGGLRDECFAEYDRACTDAGMSLLRARSETVLVVGDVDRPGVYLLDAVKAAGKRATLLEVLRAAGVRPGLKMYAHRFRASAVNSEVWQPASHALRKSPLMPARSEEGWLTGGFILIASESEKWLSPEFAVETLLYSLDANGQRELVTCNFSQEAARAVEQWQNYHTARNTVYFDRTQKPGGTPKLMSGAQEITDPALLNGCVDIDGRGPLFLGWEDIRFWWQNGPNAKPLTLAQVLALPPSRVMPTVGSPQTVSWNGTNDMEKRGIERMRVQVYDRLGGKKEPMMDVALTEARASQSVLPDGALVVYYDPR